MNHHRHRDRNRQKRRGRRRDDATTSTGVNTRPCWRGDSSAGSSFEVLDEVDGEMLGIINSSAEGNILHMDMPDPLSRLVANIQARVRGNQGGSEESEAVREIKHSICRGDDGNEGNREIKIEGWCRGWCQGWCR